MKLKNILIVVKDIGRAKQFYHDLFGLELLLDNDGNMYKYVLPSNIDSCQADSIVFFNNSGDQTVDLKFAGTNYAFVANGGSYGQRTGFWYEMQRTRIMHPGDVIYFDNSKLTEKLQVQYKKFPYMLYSDLST